jgi:hypothetical protein
MIMGRVRVRGGTTMLAGPWGRGSVNRGKGRGKGRGRGRVRGGTTCYPCCSGLRINVGKKRNLIQTLPQSVVFRYQDRDFRYQEGDTIIELIRLLLLRLFQDGDSSFIAAGCLPRMPGLNGVTTRMLAGPWGRGSVNRGKGRGRGRGRGGTTCYPCCSGLRSNVGKKRNLIQTLPQSVVFRYQDRDFRYQEGDSIIELIRLLLLRLFQDGDKSFIAAGCLPRVQGPNGVATTRMLAGPWGRGSVNRGKGRGRGRVRGGTTCYPCCSGLRINVGKKRNLIQTLPQSVVFR